MTTDIRKEIRICTVMYGGVSLAIYMNGIARELYDLVRGRGMWGVLKLLTDTDVTVDITSGTSAGGINGLFLSYALCNEREFAPLANMWREKGGIKQLLQKPDDKNANSLINSAYMQEALQRALDDMGTIEEGNEIAPTPTQKLDCFMAVTRFDGHTWNIHDFRDKNVTLKSYKGIIHLKHRKGRWEEFNALRGEGLDTKTLSEVARATSSFPFAFEAQYLDGSKLASSYWAGKSPLDKDEKAWFIDGGVLDNKPFGPALAEIYKRHASHPVDRLLFYVEPDPADKQDKAPSTGGPNVLQTAVAALSGIPSHESIAGDIEDLNQHNKKIDQYHAIFDPILETNDQEITQKQWSVYNRARLYQLITLNDSLLKPDDKRGIDLAKEILALKAFFNNQGKETDEKKIAEQLNHLDINFVIRAYYYWIYRLRDKLDDAYKEKSEKDIVKFSSYKTILIRRLDMLLFLQGQISKVLEEISDSKNFYSTLENALKGSDRLTSFVNFNNKENEGKENEYDELVKLNGNYRGTRIKYTKEFRDLYTAKNHARDQESILKRFLETLNVCVNECKKSPSQNATEIFQALDAYQLPTLTLGNMGEFDRIEYYRISPLDTAENDTSIRSLPTLREWNNNHKEKVTGKQLGHFGAILKKSWRANDIMWGRLDAATIMLEVLLTKHNLDINPDFAAQIIFFYYNEELKRPGVVSNQNIRNFVGNSAEDDPNRGFKVIKNRLEDHNRQSLFQYLRDNSDVLEAIIRCAKSKPDHNLEETILQSHQRRILESEMPQVIISAFDEEVERQQAGKKNKFTQDDPNIDFEKAAIKTLEKFELDCQDPLLRKVAADSLSKMIENEDDSNGVQKTKRLEGFIGKHYNVGEEKLEDLDKLDTATAGLQATRVVFNLIKKVIPDDSVWGTKLETFVLDRLSIMITSLHLGAVSIRQGIFPYFWAFGVATSILLLLLRTFIGEADSWPIWPTLIIPIALLFVFLSAPKFWLHPEKLDLSDFSVNIQKPDSKRAALIQKQKEENLKILNELRSTLLEAKCSKNICDSFVESASEELEKNNFHTWEKFVSAAYKTYIKGPAKYSKTFKNKIDNLSTPDYWEEATKRKAFLEAALANLEKNKSRALKKSLKAEKDRQLARNTYLDIEKSYLDPWASFLEKELKILEDEKRQKSKTIWRWLLIASFILMFLFTLAMNLLQTEPVFWEKVKDYLANYWNNWLRWGMAIWLTIWAIIWAIGRNISWSKALRRNRPQKT